MSKVQLEQEDKERDAAFNKAMHGKTAAQASGIATILFKDPEAKQAALDEYFKHFDNKKADNETEADRKVRNDKARLTHGLFLSLTALHRHGPTSTPL